MSLPRPFSANALEVLNGKRVFVTGNTGFKGSWLTLWLLELGAKVHGFSLNVPTKPSLFELADLSGLAPTTFGDVRDPEALFRAIQKFDPDVIFHLAAQPIVRESMVNPLETLTTNAIGTAQVLEYMRLANNPPVLVIITSDKVYQNMNWPWGYRESDELSKQDPYSASKAMAETVISSYLYTYGRAGLGDGISVGRAGNVIGGGDFASGRLIPDVYRSIVEDRSLQVRNPESTRPWQHVLEPLSGYLTLAACLLSGYEGIHGEAFNFGPSLEKAFTVGDVLQELQGQLEFNWEKSNPETLSFHEAQLLQLDWSKAASILSWRPVLAFDETINWTARWYEQLLRGIPTPEAIRKFTLDQLSEFRERL